MLFSNKPLLLCGLLAWAAVAKTDETNATSTCMTGPPQQDSNTIFVNGKQYLDNSSEVECNGVITAWHFCHYVIGFRNLEMELWAGAWRREDDQYTLVGLNVIVLEPPGYEKEHLRCIEREIEAADWIEAREGDFIGFFLPDNGVFIASAPALSDPEHRQMQRSEYGYAANFNVSELTFATASFGRALLRARIDTTAEKPPTTTPSMLPTTTVIDGTTPTPDMDGTTPTPDVDMTEGRGGGEGGGLSKMEIIVPVVAVVALGIIVVLLVVIIVLIVLLRRRKAEAALHPLPHPLARAVDATNPANGTTDNGSVLYEAIYSQAYIQARDGSSSSSSSNRSDGKSEPGYSMFSNPAYHQGDTLTKNPTYTPTIASPPVFNPAYASTNRPKGSRSQHRWSKRTATISGPPVPTSPPPACPAPPPPPPPYALPFHSKSSRPPALSLKSLPTKHPTVPHLQSPPSPYVNPYKSPRPVSPDYTYKIPQTLSVSSTMTSNSDQSSGDTNSTSASTSTASNTDNE